MARREGQSRASHGVGRAVAVAAAATGLVLCGTASSGVGSIYLTETFTGATADPLFTAYGSACLTGAPAGVLGPGEHPLGGCADGNLVSSPPRDAAPLGYLQLTDASNDQSGAVLFNTPIPATQGLTVVFEQWQYGSTTPATAPADGIAFFLVDGAAQLDAPGAFGGSLGYAQKRPDGIPTNDLIPGVDGGYLGIGLDVLGNYFGDWEDRGLGCAGDGLSPAGTGFRVPERDKITVRGPADPDDSTLGYCFITSTAANLDDPGATSWPSTLPVSLQGATTAVPVGATPQQADDLLVPDRRTVTVTITPAPAPRVQVTIAGPDGVVHPVLDFAAPEPVPDSYKFGFSASTGLFTDVHLIRNVVLESIDPAPILELTKTVAGAGPYRVGDTVEYSYRVVNTGLAPIDDLTVVDDRVTGITCLATTLAALPAAPANETTCSGSYVVTDADAQAGTVTNVAFASGNGGGAVSPEDDATITVVQPAPSPSTAPPTTVVPSFAPAPAVTTDPARSSSGALAASGAPGSAPAVAALAAVVVGAGLAALVVARRGRRAGRPPKG